MSKVALKDIAKRAGYSKNTVSLALRGDPQIPPPTREAIVKIANEMGYERNPTVSTLMAKLRSSKATGKTPRIALINANTRRDAFKLHPTIPTYVRGARERAAHLGYGTETFWLFDPEQTPESMIERMRAKSVEGIVLIGLMRQNRLSQRLHRLWEEFPCVVTGVRTHDPALSFACVDHYHLTLSAVRRAIALGYRRPGLVLAEVIDELVDRRFSAGFLCGQLLLEEKDRIPRFFAVDDAKEDPVLFHRWFDRHQPDVLITLYNVVFDWLVARKLRWPDDVGVIQLEWRAESPEVAGMDQHNDLTGAYAVDMVVSQVHSHEVGAPEFPRASLVSASWVDGPSVRNARAVTVKS
jgi:LacI family transcriptional regulator